MKKTGRSRCLNGSDGSAVCGMNGEDIIFKKTIGRRISSLGDGDRAGVAEVNAFFFICRIDMGMAGKKDIL